MDDSLFRLGLRSEFNRFLQERQVELGIRETLRIDLHCHDHNSNVPDETLGRMLGVPETWLPTQELMRVLSSQGMTVRTITNHNNARSCYDMLDRGVDVLVGAEFSCHSKELDVGLHVLAYGFTPRQEAQLGSRRGDLLRFLEYARENNIPCVLAHPLDFYAPRGSPSPADYDQVLLLFDTFEVVNGQRDSWQNLLVARWVQSATPERLEAISKRCGLSTDAFVRDPWVKRQVGGSDDHFGVFAGTSGTLLRHPSFDESRSLSPSEKALLALREGKCAPFGAWNDGEKLQLAFLDYFSEMAVKMEDPGLVHIMLHRGTTAERGLAVLISNSMYEIRRHERTMKFLKTFHQAIRGQGPGALHRLLLPKQYLPILSAIHRLSESRRPQAGARELETSLDRLFLELNKLLLKRISAKQVPAVLSVSGETLASTLSGLKIPSHFRALFGSVGENASTSFSFSSILDGLSFPFLASMVVAGSAFASTRVLHGKRKFKAELAERFPSLQPPRRALWLSDTFEDRNGVSRVLSLLHGEVRSRKLPIDFVACGRACREENLRVIEPLGEFVPPLYTQQPLRIPNLLEIRKLVERGGYDRLVCSTEGPMAFVTLFLKHAFNIPAYFYVHTDWLAFSRDVFGTEEAALDNIRRLLRTFYGLFDGIFVLNSEQEMLFTGDAMRLPREKVFRTSHWVGEVFRPRSLHRSKVLPEISEDEPVLLFAGRLSQEKGVGMLPRILAAARRCAPKTRLVVAGTGPYEDKLRDMLPDAHFTGWVSEDRLAEIYAVSDLLLLPSRFDTFGCVVVEAMACGLPVCAFASKGPRDIIEHGISGFLADSDEEMVAQVQRFLGGTRGDMRASALRRAGDFTPDAVLPTLLSPLGLCEERQSFARVAQEQEEIPHAVRFPDFASQSFASPLGHARSAPF